MQPAILLTKWAIRLMRFRAMAAFAAVKIIQAFDSVVRFLKIHTASPMYTMAHHLLRMPKDFRLPGVHSVMANPSLLTIKMMRWPHLPTEFVSERGCA